jgi:hypothetical protein
MDINPLSEFVIILFLQTRLKIGNSAIVCFGWGWLIANS